MTNCLETPTVNLWNMIHGEGTGFPLANSNLAKSL